ncbi:DNA adenine methylase [Paraliobacillus zengyii]|uniref:DNA adenine methylase n=1 Tax=Paraliobacillus zengyii TaxID=2213194 RepID=UPI0013008857|nr:DNA adenine methylase [Paraliobacillus zengyii]
MTLLMTAFKENTIYENNNLANFLEKLEERFDVHEEIEFFNKLVNFSENNLRPLHGWFKYREGYSHTLVREMIQRFPLDIKHEFIIDPFCGAGTTLVEASFNNIDSMGIDVNPMSVAITNAKTNNYRTEDFNDIEGLIEDILSIETDNESLKEFEDIQNYFTEENLTSLISIKRFIGSIPNKNIKDLFFSGFLSIIEESSDRKRDGNGLKKAPSKVLSVIEFYYLKMKSLYKDVGESPLGTKGTGYFGSARQLSDYVIDFKKQVNKEPGLIVFSPPYANSFDYFESYKMELRMGDYIPRLGTKGIGSLREKAVRSFISSSNEKIEVDEYIELLAEEIEKAIPNKEASTGKRDNRTRKVPQMIRGYFFDMGNILEQCSKVLSKGKKCCIVVDQSSYLGKIVPTDLLLGYLGEKVGFKVTEIIVCRKAKTSGQQIQKFPYLANSMRESIVILEKK